MLIFSIPNLKNFKKKKYYLNKFEKRKFKIQKTLLPYCHSVHDSYREKLSNKSPPQKKDASGMTKTLNPRADNIKLIT
jgi:hypothetical protein